MGWLLTSDSAESNRTAGLHAWILRHLPIPKGKINHFGRIASTAGGHLVNAGIPPWKILSE
jgi:hypothetical protein